MPAARLPLGVTRCGGIELQIREHDIEAMEERRIAEFLLLRHGLTDRHRDAQIEVIEPPKPIRSGKCLLDVSHDRDGRFDGGHWSLREYGRQQHAEVLPADR
jgi:hypothetical protein